MSELRAPTGWRLVEGDHHDNDLLPSQIIGDSIEFTYEDPDSWDPLDGWSADHEACRKKVAELFSR